MNIHKVYSHDSFSVVDSFEDDVQQRYPLTAKATYLEFDQLPGDLLIIPTGWFHQVDVYLHCTVSSTAVLVAVLL